MRRIVAVALSALSSLLVVGAGPLPAHAATPATCTYSAALFSGFPARLPSYTNTRDSWNSFTATNGSTWAGLSSAGLGRYAVMRWSPGHAPVVLQRFVYGPTGWGDGGYGSIRITGVSKAGVIVAGVQSTTDAQRRIPYAWANGHRYVLLGPSGTTTTDVVGVSDAGRIVALVQIGSGSTATSRVISWSGPTAHYTTVAYLHRVFGDVAVDRAGDIAYPLGSFREHVIFANGTPRDLDLPGGDATPATFASYGHGFIGVLGSGTYRWDLSTIPTTPTVSATLLRPFNLNSFIWTAGPRGHYIDGANASPLILRLGDGKYHGLPVVYHSATNDNPGEAIDATGRVAVTFSTGLIHFMTCH